MSLDPSTIRVHRKGRGPTLVMLHCLGMTRHLWDCLEALSDRFELISYDLPGHGETALPAVPYGVADLSVQLAAVFAREGIARAHVMGISLGGLVAQHFAATQPSMVDKLVLLDTTPRYTDEARANWAVRAAAARRDGPASLLPMILKIWFARRLRCGQSSASAPGAGYLRRVQRGGLCVGLRGTRRGQSAVRDAAYHRAHIGDLWG
jgi:3-oxoadipate enol-lactonase